MNVSDFFGQLKIAICDEESYTDRDVGFVNSDFSTFCFNGGSEYKLNLLWENAKAGTITIRSKYESPKVNKPAKK